MADSTDDIKKILGIVTTINTTINNDVASLRVDVAGLRTDVDRMRQDLDTQTQEITKLGVLFEDLEDKFKATSELISDNLRVKDRVDNHEVRLSEAESLQNILRGAVTEHSRQLKPLLKN